MLYVTVPKLLNRGRSPLARVVQGMRGPYPLCLSSLTGLDRDPAEWAMTLSSRPSCCQDHHKAKDVVKD